MLLVAKTRIGKPNRRWWVRTTPNRTRHYTQAGQGCRFYETNKWKDMVLPRLSPPVNRDNLSKQTQAKIVKEQLQ